jgi:SAM-dependent methyltransferase
MLSGCRQYVGVDIDQTAIDWACHVITPSASGTRFVQLKEFETESEGELFDLVISFEVIEHVEDAQAFAKYIATKLTPGGIAFMSTPNGAFSMKRRDLYSTEYHLEEFTIAEFDSILSLIGSSRTLYKEYRVDRLDSIQRRREVSRVIKGGTPWVARAKSNPVNWAYQFVQSKLNGPTFWRIRELESKDWNPPGDSRFTSIVGTVRRGPRFRETPPSSII